jgi:hypothetical protein
MCGEFGDDHLGQQAGASDAAAHGTRRGFGGDHAVTAMRAGVLGQDVDMKLEVGWDKLQHACLVLADACLEFAAMRAKLFGLRDIVLDAHLR